MVAPPHQWLDTFLSKCLTCSRVPGWTPEMQKFYDDIDPDMADVTLDDLIQRLPADADWLVSRSLA